MESDCEDSPQRSTTTTDTVDFNQVFAALSNQITLQNTHLQDQIFMNDLKMSQDFKQVILAHDEFKQEVHCELDELHLI
jgi:hypothetical protein